MQSPERSAERSASSVEASEPAEAIRPQPRVLYDERLQHPDCLYTVQVDAAGLGELLREAGMPDERIGQMTLKVQRGREQIPIRGRYAFFTNTATLYTDRIWYSFAKLEQKAEQIARAAHTPGQGKPPAAPKKDPFERLLVTRRLSQYLVDAPPERAVAFAHKLIRRARDRSFNQTVAHELKHAFDERNPKLMVPSMALKGAILLSGALFEAAVTVPTFHYMLERGEQLHMAPGVYIPLALMETFSQHTGALSGMLLLLRKEYQNDPLENSARKFQDTVRGDERWARLVTLTPKEPPHQQDNALSPTAVTIPH